MTRRLPAWSRPIRCLREFLRPRRRESSWSCQRNGHVVGFLGDGINDSAGLKAADVGVSVDTAVDIAKESADIILLEKNLGVLGDGVIEGRKVFGNITKYIKMGASSNFGNMFSVVGASIMLPFLPMAPIQVLTNNLLYDFSQTAIPTDNVDEDYLLVPRRWDIGNIMKFMLFIGPISSIFDHVTYFTMLYIIRTAKIPFVESLASPALIATSIIICVVGIALPVTWFGESLGFVPLPPTYWPIVIAIIGCYAALTHLTKVWFVRRWGM
jgi:Mg2+-importing ATPase